MKSIQSKGVDVRKVILAGAALAVAAAIASAGGAAATAATNTETFSAISTNPGSGVVNVIATGDFTAGGEAMTPGKGKETFPFANGKFTLVVAKGKGSKHQSLNLATCLYTKTGSGFYTLTDGTGAYKGISGSGKVSTTLRAVYPLVKGKCPSSDQPGSSGTPEAIQFIETATGPVSLP
jgi:hypothetical protein